MNHTISLSESAYRTLRDKIIRTEIPPGQALHESRLSEELGCGLTPVRSAIRRLTFEHLVTVYPRRGTFTSEINIGDERWITELRIEIEGLCARLAASRSSEEERQDLLALARSLEGDRTSAEVTDIDAAFHRKIFAMSRNTFLAASADLHFNLALRIWYYCDRQFAHAQDPGKEPLAIATAIAQGEAETAEAHARSHIRQASRAVQKLLAG